MTLELPRQDRFSEKNKERETNISKAAMMLWSRIQCVAPRSKKTAVD